MGKNTSGTKATYKVAVALYYAVRKRTLALNWRADRRKNKNFRRIILSPFLRLDFISFFLFFFFFNPFKSNSENTQKGFTAKIRGFVFFQTNI